MPDAPRGKKNPELFKNLAKCVKEFGPNGVRAVLWHQGESDSLAGTSAENYAKRMKTIVDTLSKEAGYEVSWFTAQASFHPSAPAEKEKEVARGQQLIWKSKIAHRGPVTDDLGKEYRSDGVHFNQKGLTTHATRWFETLVAQYKWKSKPSKPKKQLRSRP